MSDDELDVELEARDWAMMRRDFVATKSLPEDAVQRVVAAGRVARMFTRASLVLFFAAALGLPTILAPLPWKAWSSFGQIVVFVVGIALFVRAYRAKKALRA